MLLPVFGRCKSGELLKKLRSQCPAHFLACEHTFIVNARSLRDRHTRLYSPFDVYAKALQELFRGHELTDTEWEGSQELQLMPRSYFRAH